MELRVLDQALVWPADRDQILVVGLLVPPVALTLQAIAVPAVAVAELQVLRVVRGLTLVADRAVALILVADRERAVLATAIRVVLPAHPAKAILAPIPAVAAILVVVRVTIVRVMFRLNPK